MDTQKRQVLSQAMTLADNMKSLAADYQHLVRSSSEIDAQGQTARSSLDRRFQKLKVPVMIAELREQGLDGAAFQLEELFKATAMVFNLMAVSIGVDEHEILEIDIEGPHSATIAAMRDACST